jgi:hypothetical protein
MTLEEQETLLNQAFRPHYPIEEPSNFFGRELEKGRVIEALHSLGQHVVIYGDRGAGKTSLARVSTFGRERIDVFCEIDSSFSKLARDVILRYQKQNPTKIIYDAATNRVSIHGVMTAIDNLDGNSLKALLPDEPLIIIFDEVDRLSKETLCILGEFTKNVATDLNQITLIFVGVGDSINDLLGGHQSLFRNIKSVGLKQFKDNSVVEAILNKGGEILGLTFGKDSIDSIIATSDRLPYYVQLLGITSARVALLENAKIVKDNHVTKGASAAAQDADEILRNDYDLAILSARSEVYKYILWGLASLDGKTEGSVGQIAEATSKLSPTKISVQMAGSALKKLNSKDRANIISTRAVGPRKTFYSFTHPLMRGYVRLRNVNANSNNS